MRQTAHCGGEWSRRPTGAGRSRRSRRCFRAAGPYSRSSRVPYQPFFLEQVEAGNVEAITSREDSIEGELKKPMRYDPPGDDKPIEVDRFETQVPAFIDRAGLTMLLTEQKVIINASAPDAGLRSPGCTPSTTG